MAYSGSFDIWTKNKIASLIDATTEVITPSYKDCGLTSWLNTNEFDPAQESFGILPLTESVRQKLGMSVYQSDYAAGCTIKHNYLAKQQQTLVAVLPVHTPKEKALYRLLIKDKAGQFSGRTQPNWISLTQEWQRHANGREIFYKVRHNVISHRMPFHCCQQLPEHLKAYYKTWNEHQNEHNSIEQSKDAYDQLRQLLAVPMRIPEIAVGQRETVRDQIEGSRQPATTEPNPWQIGVLLGRSSSQQTLLELQYRDSVPLEPRGTKRPLQDSSAQAHPSIAVKKKKPRTCVTCRKGDCPGAYYSRPCKYKLLEVRSCSFAKGLAF